MNKIPLISLFSLFIATPIFINAMEGQGKPCLGYGIDALEKDNEKRKITEVNRQINQGSSKRRKKNNEQYIEMLSNTIFKRIEESDARAIEGLLAQFNNLVNAMNKNCETPFMRAIILGHTNIAITLLKYGADINAQDNIGNTALIHAAQMGDKTLVEFLVFYKADIDRQNMLGRTALMEAAEIQDLAIIEMLIHNKARIELTDKLGQTAFDICQNRTILKTTQIAEVKLKNLFNINNEPIYKAFFNPEDDIRSILIDLIRCEKRSIKIASFLMADINISRALIEAVKNGIEVELIIDKRCVNHYTVTNLYQNKVGIRIYKPQNDTALMHNKFCIFAENVDHKSLLFNGSYNFTYNASSFNQENVIILDNTSVIQQFIDQFNLLKNQSIKI